MSTGFNGSTGNSGNGFNGSTGNSGIGLNGSTGSSGNYGYYNRGNTSNIGSNGSTAFAFVFWTCIAIILAIAFWIVYENNKTTFDMITASIFTLVSIFMMSLLAYQIVTTKSSSSQIVREN